MPTHRHLWKILKIWITSFRRTIQWSWLDRLRALDSMSVHCSSRWCARRSRMNVWRRWSFAKIAFWRHAKMDSSIRGHDPDFPLVKYSRKTFKCPSRFARISIVDFFLKKKKYLQSLPQHNIANSPTGAPNSGTVVWGLYLTGAWILSKHKQTTNRTNEPFFLDNTK